MIKNVWNFYVLQNTVKNPIKTKMITATLIFAMGDITCQKVIEKKKIDFNRVCSQAIIIGLMLNPVSQWYQLTIAPSIVLNRVSSASKYKRIADNAFRGIVHWLIMTPVQGANFFYMSGFLQNWKFSHQNGIQNILSKWYIGLQASFIYWPWITILGYHYFDFHMRIPFFNVCAFIYSIGLSYINNNSVKKLI